MYLGNLLPQLVQRITWPMITWFKNKFSLAEGMPPTKKTKRKEDTTNRAARENNDMRRIIFVASEDMVNNRGIERCRRHEEKEQHQ